MEKTEPEQTAWNVESYLDALDAQLSDPNARQIFEVLATTLRQNLEETRTCGPSNTRLQRRDRILQGLDRIALQFTGRHLLEGSPAAAVQDQPKARVSAEPREKPRDLFASYKAGLAALERLLTGPTTRQEFARLASALHSNMVETKRHGDTEARERERMQLLARINVLALEHTGQAFSDLC